MYVLLKPIPFNDVTLILVEIEVEKSLDKKIGLSIPKNMFLT